jgi:hypothetical protein
LSEFGKFDPFDKAFGLWALDVDMEYGETGWDIRQEHVLMRWLGLRADSDQFVAGPRQISLAARCRTPARSAASQSVGFDGQGRKDAGDSRSLVVTASGNSPVRAATGGWWEGISFPREQQSSSASPCRETTTTRQAVKQ